MPAARIPTMDEHIVINRQLSPARLYEKIEDKNVLMYRYNKGQKEWLLVEYVPGTKMYASQAIRKDPSLVLKQIGVVAAVDCVLNNWDRVPVAHNNEGNIENWIIEEQSGSGDAGGGGAGDRAGCTARHGTGWMHYTERHGTDGAYTATSNHNNNAPAAIKGPTT